MRRVFIAILFLISLLEIKATHLVGGYVAYTHLGSTPTVTRYRITIYAYRDCKNDGTQNEVPFDKSIHVCIYNNSGSKSLYKDEVFNLVSNFKVNPLGRTDCPELKDMCLEQGIYEKQVDVANSTFGYIVKWERCCRNTQTNLQDDASGSPFQGQTYSIIIPATSIKNSSPRFAEVPVPFICANDTTVFRQSFADPDGDALTYKFVTPWQGASSGTPFVSVCDDYISSFDPVIYKNGFGPNIPFGTGGVNLIDANTGLTTYFSPLTGRFAIAIEVSERRNGQIIGTSRLDLQMLVLNCPPNKKPVINFSNTVVWRVQAGDLLCKDVVVTDSDPGQYVQLTPKGDIFTGANGFTGTKATFNPNPATGRNTTTGKFCWKTDCSQARSAPYAAIFEGSDDGCPTKFINVQVLIYVDSFVPTEAITGPSNLCQNARGVKYTLIKKSSGATYVWSVAGGTIIGSNTNDNLIVDWGSGFTGKITVQITSKFGCPGPPASYNITLNPAPSIPKVKGKDTVCLRDLQTYTSSADPGVTYLWEAFNASIVGANNGNSVQINFNSYPNAKLVLKVSNTLGCTTTSDTFKVFVSYPQPPTILGPISICPNNKNIQYQISNPQYGSIYGWKIFGGAQSSGGNNPIITVDWGGLGIGFVKAIEINRFGCKSDTGYLQVVKNHALTGQLPIGDTSICENSIVIYTVKPVNGETYVWQVTGGTIISGQNSASVTVQWGTAGVGTIAVQSTAYDAVNNLPCLSSFRTRIANIRPYPKLTPIIGNFEFCQQSGSGSYSVAGFLKSYYEWKVLGRSFSGQGTNTILIDKDTWGMFIIQVREITEFGCAGPWNIDTLIIHPKPTTKTITGSDVLCFPNINNYQYSVNGFPRSMYNWNVINGTIKTNNGNSVIVDWQNNHDDTITVIETSEFGCIGDKIVKPVFVDDIKIVSENVTVNPPPGDDKTVQFNFVLANAPRYNNKIFIQRRLRGVTAFTTIAQVNSSDVVYNDANVITDSSSYEYRAVAVNLCGDSLYTSSHTDILLKGVKTSPFDYTLKFTDYLGWQNGVASYELWRLLEDKSPYQLYETFPGGNASYTKSYNNGRDHFGMWFRIKAIENGGLNRVSWSNDVRLYFDPVLYVPNAFSPDANGLNDGFLPVSSGMKTYEIKIYSRWGEKLFETKNSEVGWNGMYLNKPCQSGVYVYVINYSDFRNKQYQAKGTIHLLR